MSIGARLKPMLASGMSGAHLKLWQQYACFLANSSKSENKQHTSFIYCLCSFHFCIQWQTHSTQRSSLNRTTHFVRTDRELPEGLVNRGRAHLRSFKKFRSNWLRTAWPNKIPNSQISSETRFSKSSRFSSFSIAKFF